MADLYAQVRAADGRAATPAPAHPTRAEAAREVKVLKNESLKVKFSSKAG